MANGSLAQYTYIHTYIGFQTEIHFKPRASPQAELRPGRLPTSRITTREAELRPGNPPTSLLLLLLFLLLTFHLLELPISPPSPSSCQLPMYECFLLGPPASSQVMSVPIYVMVCPLLCVRVFCKLEKHDTHVCMYVCVYVQKRAMYAHVSVCKDART